MRAFDSSVAAVGAYWKAVASNPRLSVPEDPPAGACADRLDLPGTVVTERAATLEMADVDELTAIVRVDRAITSQSLASLPPGTSSSRRRRQRAKHRST